MTTQHSAPSKLETFAAIFGAAIGFSVLFMFALSAFVNGLYETRGGHAASQQLASHAGHGNKGKTTYIVPHDGVPTDVKTAAQPTKPTKPDGQTTDYSAPGGSIAQMLAQGNIKKGAKVAKKCFACHSFDKGGKNKVGPNLYAIIGRKIAVHSGFKYSSAMNKYAKKATKWNYDNLVSYLKKPKKVVPKTKMAFAGLRKEKDLANIIAYMRSNADQPVPLPMN